MKQPKKEPLKGDAKAEFDAEMKRLREEQRRLKEEYRKLMDQVAYESLGHRAYKELVELAEETYSIDILKRFSGQVAERLKKGDTKLKKFHG